MTTPEQDRDRLAVFGFGEDEIDALELLWKRDEIGPLLGATAKELWLSGRPVGEAYEVAFHIHEPEDAEFYCRHGFSGHQARVIEANPHAGANLWGSRTNAELDAILAADIPRDVLINVLLAAQGPEDTDAYLRRYEAAATGTPETHGPTPDTTVSIAHEAAMLAALRLTPPDCCP